MGKGMLTAQKGASYMYGESLVEAIFRVVGERSDGADITRIAKDDVQCPIALERLID